jgi:hypothetical protein
MLKEAEDIVAILVATALGREPASQAEFDQVAATLTYVNPVKSAPPADAEVVNLTPWSAFPRGVTVQAPWAGFPRDLIDPDGSYRAADQLGAEDTKPGVFLDGQGNVVALPTRHRQDEYCEWVLRRDSADRIRKAIFVAEGYDYFSELFEADEQRVVDIYREFTETGSITADSLRAPNGIRHRDSKGQITTVVAPGGFNHRNAFNVSPGIVHLSHRANSLGAEVNLAGVSGLARKIADGTLLDGADPRRLLCCAQGGDPNRNSDPLIGKQAYAQVLAGKHYTLTNPVGLYISDFTDTSLLLPDGVTPAPRSWWRTVRGTSANRRILRLELEVPQGEGFVLGDLTINGTELKYGGQLAELLSVHLFVTRWNRAGGGVGPVVNCDATCCVKNGTDMLALSNGGCQPPFSLKYPGLLVPPAAGVKFAESAALAPRPAAAKSRLP